MTDYKMLYHMMFNAATDALEALGRLDVSAAARLLERAQVKAEEQILEEENCGGASLLHLRNFQKNLRK